MPGTWYVLNKQLIAWISFCYLVYSFMLTILGFFLTLQAYRIPGLQLLEFQEPGLKTRDTPSPPPPPRCSPGLRDSWTILIWLNPEKKMSLFISGCPKVYKEWVKVGGGETWRVMAWMQRWDVSRKHQDGSTQADNNQGLAKVGWRREAMLVGVCLMFLITIISYLYLLFSYNQIL